MTIDDLTNVEIDVLRAIRHVGWYSYLWFPALSRDDLNYPDDATDEQAQDALFSLIRRGMLEIWTGTWESSFRVHQLKDEVLLQIQKRNSETTWLDVRVNETILDELARKECYPYH